MNMTTRCATVCTLRRSEGVVPAVAVISSMASKSSSADDLTELGRTSSSLWFHVPLVTHASMLFLSSLSTSPCEFWYRTCTATAWLGELHSAAAAAMASDGMRWQCRFVVWGATPNPKASALLDGSELEAAVASIATTCRSPPDAGSPPGAGPPPPGAGKAIRSRLLGSLPEVLPRVWADMYLHGTHTPKPSRWRSQP